jgi:hypothetical protein
MPEGVRPTHQLFCGDVNPFVVISQRHCGCACFLHHTNIPRNARPHLSKLNRLQRFEYYTFWRITTGQKNLTMRMLMRRFTRLTNAFSKKVENHACAVALHAMYYNFVRIHQTLKVTPAMAAGVSDRLWEMKDLVEMLEAFEASQQRAA